MSFIRQHLLTEDEERVVRVADTKVVEPRERGVDMQVHATLTIMVGVGGHDT
jgi:hypothetical protein